MDNLDYTLFDGRGFAPLPRPSRFEVVTWQLNATVYPPGDVVRWTSTLRDPKDGGRIHSAKSERIGWPQGSAEVLKQCEETLRALGYITGLSKGI